MKLYICVHLPANEVRPRIQDLFRDKLSDSKPYIHWQTVMCVEGGLQIATILILLCFPPFSVLILEVFQNRDPLKQSDRGLSPEDIKPESLKHNSARNKIQWTAAIRTFLASWWYKWNMNYGYICYRGVTENRSLQINLISFLDEIVWLSEEQRHKYNTLKTLYNIWLSTTQSSVLKYDHWKKKH